MESGGRLRILCAFFQHQTHCVHTNVSGSSVVPFSPMKHAIVYNVVSNPNQGPTSLILFEGRMNYLIH